VIGGRSYAQLVDYFQDVFRATESNYLREMLEVHIEYGKG